MPLSSGELTLNREPFVDALPDLCRVHRHSQASDSAGGQTATWTADASTVACRVAPIRGSAREHAIGERTASVEAYTIVLEHGTAVQARDRIVWETPTPSRTFEVFAPSGRSWELSRRVHAMEVE